MVGIRTQVYVVVPQYGPLSLYTKLEGPSIAKLDSYFPHYELWMIFNNHWIFMVMALGLCAQWPFQVTAGSWPLRGYKIHDFGIGIY